jgi:hypothetical protein
MAVAAEGEPWREAVRWQSSGDDVKEITSTRFFSSSFLSEFRVPSEATMSCDLKTYSIVRILYKMI